MKNFFTSLLGALVALLLFFGGAFVLCILVVVALASLGGEKPAPSVERGAYVVFDLSGNLTDAPPPVDLGPLSGGRDHTLQLRAVTNALRAAAKDARVAGLFITGEMNPSGFGSGFAALKEVRAALLDFKASGKPIRA
ncbi:MAG: hypothetical protein RLZZ15_1251, partial [Verrucomicrobiota bacterium]